VPNLSAARALAFAASSSRLFGVAVVSSERKRRAQTFAISSTALSNAASFAFDGLWKPVIFRTNCSEAARTSSGVTGGSKLNRGLIFLHTESSKYQVEKDRASTFRRASHFTPLSSQPLGGCYSFWPTSSCHSDRKPQTPRAVATSQADREPPYSCSRAQAGSRNSGRKYTSQQAFRARNYP